MHILYYIHSKYIYCHIIYYMNANILEIKIAIYTQYVKYLDQVYDLVCRGEDIMSVRLCVSVFVCLLHGSSKTAESHQQDSYDILPPNDDGVKERVTSSHTILLYLADDFTGGSTRFFPSGNYNDPAEAVDIRHVINTQ